MLYGNEKIKKKFMDDAFKYAEENNLNLILGSIRGSISKGFEYFDSDYDTRFLFAYKDFPSKIYYTPQADENETVYRYWPEETLPYECIPFWEISSFFQHLITPGLNNSFSLGIYNTIGSTLLSPFVWDPYGIQGKVVPIINSIFVKEYKIAYHVAEIQNGILQLNNEYIIAKNYLDIIYSALVIEFCINYSMQPPVHVTALAATSKSHQLYSKLKEVITESRSKAYEYIKEDKNQEKHGAHFSIKVKTNDYLNEYVNTMYKWGQKYMKDYDFLSDERKEEMNRKVMIIYDIINDSLHKPLIKGIS